MIFNKYIIILFFLCWAFDVKAQESQQMPLPEQWQLTVEGIKSQAHLLMVENNGLQDEHQQLTEQVEKLQQSINERQDKNDQLAQLLKERHGRTDQQLRIEELTKMVKTKRQEARILEEKWMSLRKSQRTGSLRVDDLNEWRKQLEDESKHEVKLENELTDLKTADKTQNINKKALEIENKKLEARLSVLQLKKLRHMKGYSDKQLAQDNVLMYDQLKKRKDQLEANISVYESRMDDLRESSVMALSWTLQRKKLIHDLVQTDTRNNKIRDKIKVLREDIDVLRDQVAKLERRANAVKGQATQQ